MHPFESRARREFLKFLAGSPLFAHAVAHDDVGPPEIMADIRLQVALRVQQPVAVVGGVDVVVDHLAKADSRDPSGVPPKLLHLAVEPRPGRGDR